MLGNVQKVEAIYLTCGYTDLRRGIDGLVALVQTQFALDSFSNSLFLFCGRRLNRVKALLWEGDGFVLLYKRMERGGFVWPQNAQDLDAMLAWANSRNAAPKSALGMALNYLKDQWPRLTAYLKGGHIELSNNRAEHSIKPFMISREISCLPILQAGRRAAPFCSV